MRWETFAVAEMQAERNRQDVSYLTFLDELSFRMGLLNVPVGTDVGLITNQRDVVYFVVHGSALLSTDSVDVEIAEGHVVFVRGDVEHRVREVEAELDVVVFFRITVPQESDPEIAAFDPAEMTEGENLEHSVFNPLLLTSSLGVAMYMVPKGIDPDAFMRHATDEIKLIADGAARFDIGATSIMAVPGSIAFIRDGVQHQFRRVAEALDVVVLWAR